VGGGWEGRRAGAWAGGGCERDAAAAAAGDLLPQSGRTKLSPGPDAAPRGRFFVQHTKTAKKNGWKKCILIIFQNINKILCFASLKLFLAFKNS
jgi:hypothetical protein